MSQQSQMTDATKQSTDTLERVANQSHIIESQIGDAFAGQIDEYVFQISEKSGDFELCVTETGDLFLQNPEKSLLSENELNALLDTDLGYTDESIEETISPVITNIQDIEYNQHSKTTICYIPLAVENSDTTIYREATIQVEPYLKLTSDALIDPIYCKLDERAYTAEIFSETDDMDVIGGLPERTTQSVQATVTEDRTVVLQRTPTDYPTISKQNIISHLQNHRSLASLFGASSVLLSLGTFVWSYSAWALGSQPTADFVGLVLSSGLMFVAGALVLNESIGPPSIKLETPPLELHNTITNMESVAISESQITEAHSEEFNHSKTVTITQQDNFIVFEATTDNSSWKVPLENGLLTQDITEMFYDIGYEHIGSSDPIAVRITQTEPNNPNTSIQSSSGDWITPVKQTDTH